MLIGPNGKQMRKRTRQERLLADNIALRNAVMKLTKINMELGGAGGGKQITKGTALPVLPGDIENDSLAIQESFGGVPEGDNPAAEVGGSKEGV